jgi:hypothetical protein
VLEANNNFLEKNSRKGLISLFLVALLLLMAGDLWANCSSLYVIPYLAEIALAAIYIGGVFVYLISALVAVNRTCCAFPSFTGGELVPELAWDLSENLIAYFLCAFAITVIVEIARFIRPPNNPLLVREHARFPELYKFIFRPYLNAKWSLWQRMRAIGAHYRIIENQVHLLADLQQNGTRELARFEFDSDSVRILVDQPKWLRREGEVGVSLFYGIDRVYVAMFTLAIVEGQLVMLVGNLQGDGREKAELYRQITKAMHGLRPRDLLVQVLQMLAKEIGCSELRGVSDSAHRNSHLLTTGTKISTYDQIWREHGGIKDNKSGFFRLSAHINRRPNEAIPSNKRAQYRRRYQFLDDLESQIRDAVLTSNQQRLPV